MFEIHARSIRLSRGDTGVIPVRTKGVVLTDADRAVFTVRRRTGAILTQKVAAPQGDVFYIPFLNEETGGWQPGQYEWDVRIVLEAKIEADGSVTDGREVITPWMPGRFEVVKVVGEV